MMKGIDMPYSTEKGEHTAFFYGTLMAPDVLFRITMGTSKPPTEQAARLTIQPAILYDYSRRRVQFCDYPGIIPQAKHTVRGTYVTDLTDHDIFCLDAFEGDQYTRTKVEVRLLEKEKADDETIDDVAKHAAAGNLTAHELVDLLKVGLKEGKSKTAETYVFTAGLSFLETLNGDWDFEEFVTEKMAGRWADNSEEYKERDEADEAANGHDPTGGRGINSKPKVDLGPKVDWDESGDSPPGRVW